MATKNEPTLHAAGRWSRDTACGKSAAPEQIVKDPRHATCRSTACANAGAALQKRLDNAKRARFERVLSRSYNVARLAYDEVTDPNYAIDLYPEGHAVLAVGEVILPLADRHEVEDLLHMLQALSGTMLARQTLNDADVREIARAEGVPGINAEED